MPHSSLLALCPAPCALAGLQTYVNNTNAAVSKFPELASLGIEDLNKKASLAASKMLARPWLQLCPATHRGGVGWGASPPRGREVLAMRGAPEVAPAPCDHGPARLGGSLGPRGASCGAAAGGGGSCSCLRPGRLPRPTEGSSLICEAPVFVWTL